MAVVYPLANGNWSTVANWYSAGAPYGSLPLSGDDVYANGKTIEINQNITVLSLNTAASSPAVAGGVFQVGTNNLNITANINYTTTTSLSAYQSGLLTIIGNITAVNVTGGVFGINLTTSGTINITGNVISGGGTAGYAINNTFNGLVNIIGNITGGTGNNVRGIFNSNTSRITVTGIVTGGIGSSCAGILNSSTSSTAVIINGACIASVNSSIENNNSGTVTINGNQTAVGNNGVYCITNGSTGIITINGDCLGALSATPSLAYILNNGSTGIVNINGSVTARSVSPSATIGIIHNSGTGTINISSNVSGGSVANTIGISNSSIGTINVTGNITGGTHATNTPAIYSTTAGTIDVTGTTTAGLYPALISPSFTATNIITGNIVNVAGVPAHNAYKITVSPTAVQTATMQDTGNIDRLFSTSNVSVGAPAVTNVRAGVVYGSTNELTGTMIVPIPGNVRKGVPTDNTVGTAELTIAEFWDTDVSALTTTNSIGARLKNSSTVAVTGDQIAGFNV
jgi:hypothetical protein